LSHGTVESESPGEGAGARGGYSPGDPAEDADRTASEDDVSSGDDPGGDSNGEVSRQQVELAEIEEIIDGEIAPEREARLTQRMYSRWQAPIPRPADLAQYEQVCPGAADRILKLAEREVGLREKRADSVHMAMEGEVRVQNTLAEGDRDALKRGQYLASAISALVAILSFAGMFLTPWSALGFAVPLAQVATALVRTITDGNKSSRQNQDDDDDDSEEDD
jgi:uncharacterized membrane protein